MIASSEAFEASYKIARQFRENNSSVTILPVEKKLGDAMKIASNIAKKGIVLGEDEVKNGSFKVKDFTTGDQETLKF